ncbi:MAG: hypothetical protein ACUVQ1_00230 [Candidatus Kapaibacteriales bacterium]
MLLESKPKIKILMLIITFGVGIFLYVHNVISINSLTSEIFLLQKQRDKIIEENLILQREINKLEDPTRIIPLVETKLQMKAPNRLPIIIE